MLYHRCWWYVCSIVISWRFLGLNTKLNHNTKFALQRIKKVGQYVLIDSSIMFKYWKLHAINDLKITISGADG